MAKKCKMITISRAIKLYLLLSDEGLNWKFTHFHDRLLQNGKKLKGETDNGV